MPPKYHVSWIRNNSCKTCGHVHKEVSTWGYSTPEAAMDQAIFVLFRPNEYVLLFVEQ